jgi:hypothetical protein
MSASILIVLNTGILSCDSHPNARNLWNWSQSRHCMIWLGFSRWLYPLLSWCGKIPVSDWQLRQDLNWKFYFFCIDADNGNLELRGASRFWSRIEIFSLDLAFQMATWAIDISDSDSAGWTATKRRNRDSSIYRWVCMYIVCCFSCWSLLRVCHSSWVLQIW